MRSGIPSVKLVLAGEVGVGKTSIRRSFMGESFSGEYMSTIGSEVSYMETDKLNLSIFDLAGDPNFEHVRITLYAGTKAAVMVFDVMRPETLEKIPKWITELRRYTPKETPIIIVGNKIDLIDGEEQKKIHDEFQNIINGMAADHNIFPEPQYTSAKTGVNIESMFDQLGTMVLETL